MSEDIDSFGSKVTGGRIAATCLIIVAAYIGWLAVTAPETKAPVAKLAEAPVSVEVTRYVLRTVNVRQTPSLKAKVMGQHLRGAKITGFLEQDTSGTREWLKLADKSGFVSTNMLAQEAPPALDEMLGADYYFTVDAKVMTKPDASSMALGEGGQDPLFATGRAGEWIEILWKGGKVAYIHRDSLLTSVADYNATLEAAAVGAEAAAAGAAEAAGNAATDAAQF